MSSTENKITDLEHRIEELKKKRLQSSINDRDETKPLEETQQKPKTPLTPIQKCWLYSSLPLTVISILSIVETLMLDQYKSVEFEAFISIYQAVFHTPVNWLLELLFSGASDWLSISVPLWIIDTVVFIMSSVISINILTIRDMGKSYWSVLASEVGDMTESSGGNPGPVAKLFSRIVLVVYSFILLVFAPLILLFGYRSAKKQGEADSWRPIVSLADAYFRVILLFTLPLTLAALVANAVLNVGLAFLGL